MKKYKAYIFDFDGTLMDSFDGVSIAFERAFKRLNIPFDVKDVRRIMSENFVLTAKRYNIAPNDMDNFMKVCDEEFHNDEIVKLNKPFPDALEMIRYFIINKIPSAIVSCNKGKQIELILKDKNIIGFPNVIIGHEDVKENKPNPAGLLLAIEKLKVNKDEVCYVGDAINDMLAAKNAGIDGIYINRNKEKIDVEVAKTIYSLKEIIKS